MATEDRSAVHGLEKRLFHLVLSKATSAQWAEWLRAPLEHALAEGDKDLAMSLLKAGANGGAGWKGCDGRTLLDAAVEGGNRRVVSALLKVGGMADDLNAVSGAKSMTALHRACKGGHSAVAQALLVEGVDVGLADSDGRSALHYALDGGHKELAKHVIAAGADLNAKDINGDTPLHLAAMNGCDELVCTLLRRGVGVDVVNRKGQSALHVTIEEDRINSAETLLKAGANPNLRYDGAGIKQQCSPLHFARKKLAMTRMLLKHGADLKGVDSIGYTALHWAANCGTSGVIDSLVEGGADLEARSANVRVCTIYRFRGLTPLHVAASLDNFDAMAALLNKGADIHAKDDDGQTPLHVVCRLSPEDLDAALETADFLLRRGADENITDNDDHTPEDLIESSEATRDLKQLLANAPADRTWRRRGMLVMCRAYSAKMLGGVGDGKAGKVRRQRNGVGPGAAADGDGADGERYLLTRVVRLEADEVFRTILRFL